MEGQGSSNKKRRNRGRGIPSMKTDSSSTSSTPSTPAMSTPTNTQEISDKTTEMTEPNPSPVSRDEQFSTPLSSPSDPQFKVEEQAQELVVPPVETIEEIQKIDPSPPPSTVQPTPIETEAKDKIDVKNNVSVESEKIQNSDRIPSDKEKSDESQSSGKGRKGKSKPGGSTSNGEEEKKVVKVPSPVQSTVDLTTTEMPGEEEGTNSTLRVGPGLVGKPGYFGQFGPGRGEDDSDSDDSVLQTTSRRGSVVNSGGGRGLLGFTRRQVLTLVVFSLADFFSAIIISLQAPFYPREAEDKGATATEYGFVFGIFELVVFLTSPIFGKYLPKIGPKVVFNVGILTTAVATVLFGFLDQFDDRTTFIALSFFVRSVAALGDAAFVTASFAIIATEFPDSVATTFASLETFFGLGLIVGPTVGGALYEKGGFTLPFGVMGGLLLVVALLTIIVMPKMGQVTDVDKKGPGGIFAVLRVPGVLLAAANIITSAITIGFLNATLEPHIRQFALAPVMTGLVFIINGGLYAISAPAWGWVVDKNLTPKYILLFGNVTIFIGFLVLGPAPFMPGETILWLTCVGLVIHGIGLGAALVASFVMALRESINHGFPDSIHTYGLTSALWTSSFALGSFVGPSVGGILLDKFGFRWATVFVLGWIIAMMILVIGFIFKTRGSASGYYTLRGSNRKRILTETAPLITDPTSSSKLNLEKETTDRPTGGYGAT